MADRFIQTHIRKLTLFQNLTDQQLAIVSEAFQVMRFEPGEWVFRQGNPTRGLYLFVSGQAILTQTGGDGLERQVGFLGENEFIDKESLFQQLVEQYSCRVVQTAIVLFLDRTRFNNVLRHHPEIKPNLGMGKSVPYKLEKPLFKGQGEDEQVLLVTRRHWWAWVRRLWLPMLIIVAGLVLATLLSSALISTAIVGMALIVAGVLGVYFYIEWRNDTIIITDQRVVRIEHEILTFKESRRVITLDSIQEINVLVSAADVLARVFNYGTIELKTAGSAGNMHLQMIPYPDDLQKLILEDRDLFKQEQKQQQRQVISADIDRWLGYDDGQQSPTAPQSPEFERAQSGGGWRFPAALRFIGPNGELIYRKHYVVWMRYIAVPLTIMLVALGIGVVDLMFDPFDDLKLVILGFAGLIFVFGGVWFYFSDWDWRNDLYIIDDNTVTIVRKRPLWLADEDDRVLLQRVDNVAYDRDGFWRNMLDYGDVRISIIGADTFKQFHAVPSPHEVQAEILRRQARVKQNATEAEANRSRQYIQEYLQVYHDKMQPDSPQGQPNAAREFLPNRPLTERYPQPTQYDEQGQTTPSYGQYPTPQPSPNPQPPSYEQPTTPTPAPQPPQYPSWQPSPASNTSYPTIGTTPSAPDTPPYRQFRPRPAQPSPQPTQPQPPPGYDNVRPPNVPPRPSTLPGKSSAPPPRPPMPNIPRIPEDEDEDRY